MGQSNKYKAEMLAYEMHPKSCLHCGTLLFPGTRRLKAMRNLKFCGHPCAAAYNNVKYPKRKPEGQCDECSAPVRAKIRYCSATCRAKVSYRRAVERAKLAGGYVVDFRRRVKQKAVEHLGGCCCFCGYSRCIGSLQFHHVNPAEKDFVISGVSVKFERIMAELKKCILVCSNCHGEIHNGLITQEQVQEKFYSRDTERTLYLPVKQTPQGIVGSTPTA